MAVVPAVKVWNVNGSSMDAMAYTVIVAVGILVHMACGYVARRLGHIRGCRKAGGMLWAGRYVWWAVG